MRYFGRSSIALFALALFVSASGYAADCSAFRANVPAYGELAKIFNYDAHAPLDLKVLGSDDDHGLTVQSIDSRSERA